MEFRQVSPDLIIGCEEDEEHRLVFEFDGELEFYFSDDAEQYVNDVLAFRPAEAADHTQAIVIDMQKLRFVDSSGIRFLLSLDFFAKQNEYRLILRRPSDITVRLLAVTGLGGYFEMGS